MPILQEYLYDNYITKSMDRPVIFDGQYKIIALYSVIDDAFKENK